MVDAEVPNKLTKGSFSNKTKMIRAIASGKEHVALPITQVDQGNLGLFVTMDAGFSYLRANGLDISEVITIKNLEQRISDLGDDERVFFVTLAERSGQAATGFIFYKGEKQDAFRSFVTEFTPSPRINMWGNIRKATTLNADHPNLEVVGAHTLRGDTLSLIPSMESDGIAIQKDSLLAGISRRNALILKEAMFPNNAEIISDVTATELNQRSGPITEQIHAGTLFARVITRDRWQNTDMRDMTLIPGYAVEFLDIGEDGAIRGVKNAPQLRISFSMQATIDTDFQEKTRFRLNSELSGQLAIVERAISQLTETQKKLHVQGHPVKASVDGKERRVHYAQGHIKFDTQLNVAFTLNTNGQIDDFAIGTMTPNALAKNAMSVETVNMIYRGTNYGLRRG